MAGEDSSELLACQLELPGECWILRTLTFGGAGRAQVGVAEKEGRWSSADPARATGEVPCGGGSLGNEAGTLPRDVESPALQLVAIVVSNAAPSAGGAMRHAGVFPKLRSRNAPREAESLMPWSAEAAGTGTTPSTRGSAWDAPEGALTAASCGSKPTAGTVSRGGAEECESTAVCAAISDP